MTAWGLPSRQQSWKSSTPRMECRPQAFSGCVHTRVCVSPCVLGQCCAVVCRALSPTCHVAKIAQTDTVQPSPAEAVSFPLPAAGSSHWRQSESSCRAPWAAGSEPAPPPVSCPTQRGKRSMAKGAPLELPTGTSSRPAS